MKLEIKNLSKSYNENKVLENINYTFTEGKIYALLGRNGSGKTTLFNVVNSDIKKDSGDILLDDKYLDNNDIGYVTSNTAIPEFLTAREFLSFFIEINKDKEFKSIDYYFDLVKINKNDQDRLLKDYSKGMKNKMQILINIIANPKIILLDEPLTSLDIVVQDDMKKLLKQLKKERIIIFSTHILELALDLCDEIILLHNKQLEKVTNKDSKYIIDKLKEDKYD